MGFIGGFFMILYGALFIYLGAAQMVFSAMPHEQGMKAAEIHGRWVRENVFHLPPSKIDRE